MIRAGRSLCIDVCRPSYREASVEVLAEIRSNQRLGAQSISTRCGRGRLDCSRAQVAIKRCVSVRIQGRRALDTRRQRGADEGSVVDATDNISSIAMAAGRDPDWQATLSTSQAAS
jgi:hypothetical protein